METNKKEKNFSNAKKALGDVSDNNSKLERFTKNKKQKRMIIFFFIGLVLLVGIVTLYKTFALYEEKLEFNVLQGRVPEYTSGDVKIVAIIDGEKSDTIPGKNNGYVFESVTCDNEAIGEWDNDKWGLYISNLSKSKTVCTIFFNKEPYKELILNGADPVLADNLIPVVIDNTGVVTKANLKEEWYKYEDKRWANAVILEDETKTYNDGEEIPESNIESYFVWIPRYKYKIWTNGNYASETKTINAARDNGIDIIFENKDTTPSTNTNIGSYYTHPAFVSMDTNGLWVGKFETGYRGAKSYSAAQVNSEDSAKVIIKPNVYSWRGFQVANAFYTTYNYKRDLDSHMMKNTEWGAVAYLTNSQYGRCISGTCEEVTINNNAYITGYAGNTISASYDSTILGVDGTSTYNYKNPLSVMASTTRNYTGVYDMSGGSWEYMMGVTLDSTNTNPLSGGSSSSNSGFKGNYGISGSNTTGKEFPESKYYDTYQYGTNETDYNKRYKYGDATGELGPFTSFKSSWYDDGAYFIGYSYPWFSRGGCASGGASSGLFDFYHHDGGTAYNLVTFRIVLAI